ncbi:DUF167 domain-containing protein [Noviherbaspirillum galbum]|uniref:UPF0235 protein G3574_25430 n=1 Tax=Noviherbaspirillum galbum TaxID=2709383 RepID=A0A6B3SUN9_9BURK|nr:DUF167 domain-containing protein [Noviherbaspirillum galbum]NEX64437.1 DUF167 domain-containing protein [Noviherbaspirillum galbum]
MNHPWCGVLPHGLRLTVQVAPNARRSEAMGLVQDAIKIRLQAQPIEGRANDALLRFLADTLQVPRSAITITHGQSSRRKTVDVRSTSLSAEQAAHMLGINLEG